LQLSERSPNRSQIQKLVVRVGNTPTTRTALKVSDYERTNRTQFNMLSEYKSRSLRNSNNSLSKPNELIGFNGKSQMNYDLESDIKSKSFDDDICFDTKLARKGSNNRNAFSGNRAFSQDRILLAPPTETPNFLLNSQNYGGIRLCDVSSTRSPVKNFNRFPPEYKMSRERSPMSSRRSRERERGVHRDSAYSNRSAKHSPSDSEDSVEETVNKSLVAEYLYGLRRKQQRTVNLSKKQKEGSPSSSGRY
jgi:hypothetical protein